MPFKARFTLICAFLCTLWLHNCTAKLIKLWISMEGSVLVLTRIWGVWMRSSWTFLALIFSKTIMEVTSVNIRQNNFPLIYPQLFLVVSSSIKVLLPVKWFKPHPLVVVPPAWLMITWYATPEALPQKYHPLRPPCYAFGEVMWPLHNDSRLLWANRQRYSTPYNQGRGNLGLL